MTHHPPSHLPPTRSLLYMYVSLVTFPEFNEHAERSAVDQLYTYIAMYIFLKYTVSLVKVLGGCILSRIAEV